MAGRFRSYLRDLCLGLALTLALALGLEGLLRACGPALPAPELSRGFDARASYLVPDPDCAGGFRTQFSEGRSAERRIPPRDVRTRVLLLGGSNTAGLSSSTLEQLLDAGPRDHEVINLGRVGYGSARVAILAEQALELLDPDILFVYSGHNEFVERSFRMDLGPTWIRSLRSLAGRSLLLRSVTDALAPAASLGAGRRPEAWSMEYAKFKGITYDETLVVLELYRENLRAICSAAARHGVPVLLSTVIHNLYSAPFESSLPPSMDPAQVREFDAQHASAIAARPDFLAPLLPSTEHERVHGFDWSAGPQRADAPAMSYGRRPGLGELAGRASGHASVAGWNAKVWQLWGALERLKTRELDPAEEQALARAEVDLQAALGLCPDHPQALFELGLVQQLLGRAPERYVDSLKRAARFDRAPRRGNDATNDVIREVAEEFPGAQLLDADALFASRVPDGLMGWEWMADHCHIVGGAKRVLLEDVAELVRKLE